MGDRYVRSIPRPIDALLDGGSAVTAADRDPHSDIGADPGSDSDIGDDVDADPNPDAAGLGAAGDFGVDALDRIEFLARSPVRVRLLAAIADGDGLTKNELRDRLDASRTTVGRNLEALRDQGLVTKGNCEYTLTRAGEIVTGDVLDLAGTIEIARELEPLLEWVPDGALDIDLRHFADATVLAPEPGDPWSMINHHVQVIRRTEYDRNVLNVIGLHGYETGYGKIVEGSAHTELVVTPEIAETIRSDPNYAELTPEMLNTGRFEIHVYDGRIPYSISILDGTVQLGATDYDGQPRALLESDAEAVKEWATAKYEAYKREAEPFSMETTR
jgi:predicted transcriptional regulator